MIAFRIFDATSGLLIGVGRSSSLDDLFVREGHVAVEADTLIPAENTRLNVQTMVEEHHERVDVPPFPGGAAPLTLDMAELPTGTLVRARNNAGATVQTSDPADPVRLTTPGAYDVQIRPPFPWRDLDQIVEVTDA